MGASKIIRELHKKKCPMSSVRPGCQRHYETKCSEESLEMLRFAMANATLRERYTQHDKTDHLFCGLLLKIFIPLHSSLLKKLFD
jgi:hypothetical protein